MDFIILFRFCYIILLIIDILLYLIAKGLYYIVDNIYKNNNLVNFTIFITILSFACIDFTFIISILYIVLEIIFHSYY